MTSDGRCRVPGIHGGAWMWREPAEGFAEEKLRHRLQLHLLFPRGTGGRQQEKHTQGEEGEGAPRSETTAL